MAVILGDNIFEEAFFSEDLNKYFQEFERGAMIFLKEVSDPERFGVAEIKNNRVISIEEKPKKPKSNLAVTGLYFYDSNIFDKIRKLKPSKRGELEITDVNNMYLEQGELKYQILKGFWGDAGTCESRKIAEKFVRESGLEKEIMNKLF